jgi:Cupin-like domain
MNHVQEWHNVNAAVFRDEIAARNQPAILRGFVSEWPAVQHGLRSPLTLANYLKACDTGQRVDVLHASAAIRGRFFYTDDMHSLNFERRTQSLGESLDQMLAHSDDATPPAIAIQSASIPEHLPAFAGENVLSLLGPAVVPRIWLGNAITVATHFDQSQNFACVVAGRRRFTFFPPEQIANLYVGPFEFTPAGTPVSMVSVDEPDLARYPRYATALEHAQIAEVEPGDVVYIPYFWWHHVRSLAPFNVLVNYWWNDAQPGASAPFDCLLLALISLRELPPEQRSVWRSVFDHYIFQTQGDPAAHIPPHVRGVLGSISAEQRRTIRTALTRSLNKP